MSTLGSGVGSGAQNSVFGSRSSGPGRTALRSGPGAVSAADKHSEHSNTDIEPRDLAPVLTPERSSQQPAIDSRS